MVEKVRGKEVLGLSVKRFGEVMKGPICLTKAEAVIILAKFYEAYPHLRREKETPSK
jgi:hypothetical protein